MIEAREEFDDVDLVFPWKTPFLLERKEHTYVRPWYVRTKDEEIRVTVKHIEKHVKRRSPMFVSF